MQKEKADVLCGISKRFTAEMLSVKLRFILEVEGISKDYNWLSKSGLNIQYYCAVASGEGGGGEGNITETLETTIHQLSNKSFRSRMHLSEAPRMLCRDKGID